MQNKLPSMKKNYVFNLAYQLLAVCLPLITTPYISRVLNADGIGAYSYTVSVATYFSIFAALGIATYGQLKIAECRDDAVRRSELFWELLIARLCTTAVAIIVYFITEPIFGTYSDLYAVMVINIVSVALDLSWFFQGLELFQLTVSRNFVVRIVCTVLIFVFVKEPDDLIVYALIMQGSTLVGNISLFPYMKKYLVKVKWSHLRFYSHWRQSLVYFIPTIATSVYTVLDKSMIGWITNSAFENGYYEQAHKIEQVLVVAVTSLGTVTLPRMVYLFKSGDKNQIKEISRRTIGFILVISIPMCVGLCSVSSTLIPIFLGEGYEPCINLLRIFSLLLIFVGLDNTIGKQCLVSTGRQKQYNKGVITGAIVNLCVNLILIPLYGATGAAIASVLAEFVILSYFIYCSRDFFDVSTLFKMFVKYGLMSCIMGLIVVFVGKRFGLSVFSLIMQILIGGCVYFFLLVITKDEFFVQTFNMIKGRFKK